MYTMKTDCDIHSTDIKRQVVICRLNDNRLTVRGAGQKIPNDCTFLGVGNIVFPISENESISYEEEIEPIALETDIEVVESKKTAIESLYTNNKIMIGKDELIKLWNLIQQKVILISDKDGNKSQAQWHKQRYHEICQR